jgi:hypothetical protein
MPSGESLMQIPRAYRTTDGYLSSFASLVRRPDGWYLDTPYYCYAGDHQYRRLPASLQRKITIISLFGDVVAGYRAAIKTMRTWKMRTHVVVIRANYWSTENRANRKWQRDMDQMFRDL